MPISPPFIPRIRPASLSFISLTGILSKGKECALVRLGKSRIALLTTIEAITEASKLEKSGQLSRQGFNSDYLPILGQGAFTAPENEWEHHKRRIMAHLKPSADNRSEWERAATNAVRDRLTLAGQNSLAVPDSLGFCLTIVQKTLLRVLFGTDQHLDLDLLHRLTTTMVGNAEMSAGLRLVLSHWADWFIRPFQFLGKRAGARLETRLAEAGALPGYPAADPQFRPELRSLLFAAQDTLTFALFSCCWLLGCQPQLQHTLRQQLCSEQDRPPLLRQVILETLRLLPPVHTPPARVSVDQTVIGATTIPAGTLVLYGLWHAQRRCPQPQVFDPRRFEDPKASRTIAPFGAGPKRCVGEHMALSFLSSALAELLRSRTIETLDQTLVLKARTVLTPTRPIRIRFQALS